MARKKTIQPQKWHSQTRTSSLNADVREKNHEFHFVIKPGTTVWQYSAQLPEQYILRSTHGAVVDSTTSQQALARCVLTVSDQMSVYREIRLDMITVHDYVLQAQVDRLERLFVSLIDVAEGKVEGDVKNTRLREALSRLGYKPTAKDLREFSPPLALSRGSHLAVGIEVDEDLDFDPFAWRLTVHGAYTGR